MLSEKNKLLKTLLISSVASTFLFGGVTKEMVLEKLNKLEQEIKL